MRKSLIFGSLLILFIACESNKTSTGPSDPEDLYVTLSSQETHQDYQLNSAIELDFKANTPVTLELYKDDAMLKEFKINFDTLGNLWFNPDVTAISGAGKDLDAIGDGYSICIVSTENPDVCDVSDATFSLSSAYLADHDEDFDNFVRFSGDIVGMGLDDETVREAPEWNVSNSNFNCTASGKNLAVLLFNDGEDFTQYHGSFVIAADVSITDLESFVSAGLGFHTATGGMVALEMRGEGKWGINSRASSKLYDVIPADDLGLENIPNTGDLENTAILASDDSGRLTIKYNGSTGQLDAYFDSTILGSWNVGDIKLSNIGFCQELDGQNSCVNFKNFAFYGDLGELNIGNLNR